MAVISSSLRGDTGGDAQTIEQTPPVGEAETADWKLTCDAEFASCLKPLCNCTRQEPQMARPVFYQVAGSIGGERLRCGEDVCRGSIKNIISPDHSRHKEGGQPSRYDWMSPHMLGPSPASKILPFGTLDSRHRISPGPISGNWTHLRGAGVVLNHRLMELKTFMTHAKEVWALFRFACIIYFWPGTWKQTRQPYGCALKMDAVC